jgi:drug/metabolite transporter (DMT)-like permease
MNASAQPRSATAPSSHSSWLQWLGAPQLGLSLAALLWSGNFIVGRALRGEIDPLTLNFCRWVVAAVVLAVPFLRPLLQQWSILRRHLGFVAALGLAAVAVPHTCIYAALATTTPVNALLLLNLVPLLVAAGARCFFGQALRPRQWCGMAVCLAGAAALMVQGDPAVLRGLHFAPGDLWMAAAVLAGAAHVLLLKKTPAGVTQGPLLLASTVAALLMMAPLLVLAGRTGLETVSHHWGNILYTGVLASAAAFVLWNRGVASVGPQRAAPFMYLMPVYGALLSVMVLREPLHGYQAFAGLIVLAGLALARPGAAPGVRSGRPRWRQALPRL